MVTTLDDMAVFKDHDRLTVLYGRQTVCDYKYCTVLHQRIHTALYDRLCTCIDRGSRLIKDHNRRVGNRRTGDRDQLTLALRQLRTVGSQNSIVSLRELTDKVMCIRKFCCFDTFLISRLQVAIADVIHNRSGKQIRILKNDSQRMTKICLLDLIDVDIVITDLTVCNIIEAVDQVRDRRFTGTGRTDKCDLLTRLCIERHIIEDLLFAIIAEVNIEETYITADFFIGQRSISVRMLPRPDIRCGSIRLFSAMRTLERQRFLLRNFCQSIAVFLAVNESNISVVRFRLFIHKLEDTGGTGHRHDDRVHLLRHLGYRHDKGLRQLQEGSDNTDGDRRYTALDRQESSDKSDQHIQDVSDIAHDRHQDVCEDIRLRCIFTELFILFIKSGLRAVLIGEYLDDFLSVDHLLDVSVHITQRCLLLHEVLRTLAADLSHQEDHGKCSYKHHDRQLPAGHDHTYERRDDRDRRGDHLWETLRDHLTQGINIVGVMAHYVAM